MKKIGPALICFGVFALSVAAQSSRPRVVVEDKAPVLKGETTSRSERQAPVLIGKTTPEPVPAEVPAPVDEDDDVIKVETNLVTLPVSVLDRDGRFISGLSQQDFQIFENGTQQRVEFFQSVEQPFTVILMIDVSPSTQFRIEEIQDAAIAFVNQLRRDDKVMVIAFDDKVNILSQVTGDRRALQSAIRQARFGDGTSLYESVDHVLKVQLPRIQGRKAVVLFTDGVDTTSRRSNYQSSLRDAEESEALFYPIRYDTQADMNGGGWGGGGTTRRQPSGGIGSIIGVILGGGNVRVGGGRRAGSTSTEYETGRRYLEELARTSGGRSFEARNNLDAAFSGIAEELRRQYSVGYYPEKAGNPGERRQIRIRVKRANVVVKAKTSYIVGKR